MGTPSILIINNQKNGITMRAAELLLAELSAILISHTRCPEPLPLQAISAGVVFCFSFSSSAAGSLLCSFHPLISKYFYTEELIKTFTYMN